MGRDGRILIVDDRASSYERIAGVLSTEHDVKSGRRRRKRSFA
jgi:hypothetical protein